MKGASEIEASATTMSVPDFAEFRGFKRSYGYQLKKEGRLVMAADGKQVLVAESLALHEATRDPSKAGVVARHAQARAEAAAPVPEAEPDTDTDEEEAPPGVSGRYDFQGSKAKREHFAAEREHAEFLKDSGELIKLTTHIAAMADIGATVRSKLEAWANILPPQLFGRDEAAVRATLVGQVEQLLRDIADRTLHHVNTGKEDR